MFVTIGKISFFFYGWRVFYGYIYHIFFIHLSIDRHLGHFYNLAFVNNPAINMDVQISLWDPDFISFWYTPRSGIAGSYGNSILIFWGTSILFSTVAAPVYIPINSVQGFPFLHILANIHVSCLFYNSHSNRCEVISHCGLGLHFHDDKWCWAPFRVLVGHLYIFFGKMSIQLLCPFLIQIICYCCFVWVIELYVIYFGY